jgi:hypothetical protein
VKFQVGDRVQLINSDWPSHIGAIGVVLSLPKGKKWWNVGPPAGYVTPANYLVDFPHGKTGAPEDYLRKLPPDDKQDYLPPETRKLFDGHKVKNPDQVKPKTEVA